MNPARVTTATMTMRSVLRIGALPRSSSNSTQKKERDQ
jgi:hypothetical protein